MRVVRLIIVLAVLGLIAWLIKFLPLPAPFPEIIFVVIIVSAVILIIWELLSLAGYAPSIFDRKAGT